MTLKKTNFPCLDIRTGNTRVDLKGSIEIEIMKDYAVGNVRLDMLGLELHW